jgi:hypothetical protein
MLTHVSPVMLLCIVKALGRKFHCCLPCVTVFCEGRASTEAKLLFLVYYYLYSFGGVFYPSYFPPSSLFRPSLRGRPLLRST